jgi:hypothetical protein
MLTRLSFARPRGVTLRQVPPPWVVRWIRPSSEPAQITFGSTVEGEIAKTSA